MDRRTYADVRTKIFRMKGLPYFPTHGAPRAPLKTYLILILQYYWWPATYAKLTAKGSRKRLPSIVLLHGRLREPIPVSDQLQLRPLFWIPEVVAYGSFDSTQKRWYILLLFGPIPFWEKKRAWNYRKCEVLHNRVHSSHLTVTWLNPGGER